MDILIKVLKGVRVGNTAKAKIETFSQKHKMCITKLEQQLHFKIFILHYFYSMSLKGLVQYFTPKRPKHVPVLMNHVL